MPATKPNVSRGVSLPIMGSLRDDSVGGYREAAEALTPSSSTAGTDMHGTAAVDPSG